MAPTSLLMFIHRTTNHHSLTIITHNRSITPSLVLLIDRISTNNIIPITVKTHLQLILLSGGRCLSILSPSFTATLGAHLKTLPRSSLTPITSKSNRGQTTPGASSRSHFTLPTHICIYLLTHQTFQPFLRLSFF